MTVGARPSISVPCANRKTLIDRETAYAFEQQGGSSDILHINRLLESPGLTDDYQILCLPGGFSYGDDIAAGRIAAGQMRHHLFNALESFRDQGKLILGICNGPLAIPRTYVRRLPGDQKRVTPRTMDPSMTRARVGKRG